MDNENRNHRTSKKTIDVELPIYRAHYLDSYTSYMKVYKNGNGNLTEETVDISKSGVEIEVDKNYQFDNSRSDYLLGKGSYKSSEEEFLQAVKQAKEIIDSIQL